MVKGVRTWVKKILNLQCDILVLIGIYFAIRFIYTKEIYIQVNGYTVNMLGLFIETIEFVGICRSVGEKASEKIKSIK